MIAFLYFGAQCLLMWLLLKIFIKDFTTTVQEAGIVVGGTLLASYIFGFVGVQFVIASMLLLLLALATILVIDKKYPIKKAVSLTIFPLLIGILGDHTSVFLVPHIPMSENITFLQVLWFYHFGIYATTSLLATGLIVKLTPKLRESINESESLQIFVMIASIFCYITLNANLFVGLLQMVDSYAEVVGTNLAFFVFYLLASAITIAIYAKSVKINLTSSEKKPNKKASGSTYKKLKGITPPCGPLSTTTKTSSAPLKRTSRTATTNS
ncbi:MAG: hypothetical protein FWF59_08375 [Turicibacter sp.]|nr:hypothetical protein [Turicibacter sp.]